MKKKKSILIVEDDFFTRDFLNNLLKASGYNVFTADDKHTAFEIMEGNAIDGVIADWRLADTDGIELLSQIRDRYPFTATILITGFGSTDIVIRAFKEGKVSYFLSKPFKNEELLAALESSLREQYLIKEKELIIKNLELMLRSKSQNHKASAQIDSIEIIHSYLTTLFEKIPHPVFILDENGEIIKVNDNCKDVFDIDGNGKNNLFKVLGFGNGKLSGLLKQLSEEKFIKNRPFEYNGKTFMLTAIIDYTREFRRKSVIMGMAIECSKEILH